jgi:LCP family protein required for cell wall assembly
MMKWKAIFKWTSLSVALVAVFFLIGQLVGNALMPTITVTGTDEDASLESGISPDDKRVNILLLGVDARAGESDDSARSDVMILASIDPQLKKVALVSLPRDTRVSLNGSVHKLGEVNYYGGIRTTRRLIEDILKVKIDYYMRADFQGFSEIIDAIDGVEVDVAERMYKPMEGIDLQSGIQTLNGRQALAYVRYREYSQGDIGRVAVQQQFLKTLAAHVLQPASLTKIPAFVRIARDYVSTDMGLKEMLRLGSWATSFQAGDILTQTLPGYFYDVRDSYGNLLVSYWEVDERQAANLLEGMFAGKSFVTVAQANNTVIIGPLQPAATKPEELAAPKTDIQTPEASAEKLPEGDASDLEDSDTVPVNSAPGLTEDNLGADPPAAEGTGAEIITLDDAPAISDEELEWQRARLEEAGDQPADFVRP